MQKNLGFPQGGLWHYEYRIRQIPKSLFTMATGVPLCGNDAYSHNNLVNKISRNIVHTVP